MTDKLTQNIEAGKVADVLAAFRMVPGVRVALRQIRYRPTGGIAKAAVLAVLSIDGKDLELIKGSHIDFAIAPAGTVAESETK